MNVRVDDRELSAMQAILAALQPLDATEQARVLRWARERLGGVPQGHGPDSEMIVMGANDPLGFADAARVVEEARASNGPERALCVGYFIQEVTGNPGFSGQDVNSALKNLGHPLSNVTKTLGDLRAQRPSLVMQVNKSGRAKQARKTYRLTTAGIERVRAMLLRAGTGGVNE